LSPVRKKGDAGRKTNEGVLLRSKKKEENAKLGNRVNWEKEGNGESRGDHKRRKVTAKTPAKTGSKSAGKGKRGALGEKLKEPGVAQLHGGKKRKGREAGWANYRKKRKMH